MLSAIFQFLTALDGVFWGYMAFVLVMAFGLYFTYKSRFFQIRCLPRVFKTFFQFLGGNKEKKRGVHPIKAFLTSTGGMIGIGNVVGVVLAIQLGGPGALLWLWIAGIIGAVIKYCEIYLGLKYRVENQEGGYDGGPMYFLKKAFGSKLIPFAAAALFCIYGIDVYQFSVISQSIALNWHLNHFLVIGALLGLILYAVAGGIKRVSRISSWIMPLFLLTYLLMGGWVLIHSAGSLPAIFADVFRSAFTGHAAVGGFAGSSFIMAVQHGISRAAYSSDIGIGYDSIIQSESRTIHPEKQGHLAILGVLVDNLICTFSILVVLASGVWKTLSPLQGSEIIQTALSSYFPYMQYFVPFFFFVTGYTTIIAFFVAGIKCARYLSPKWGKGIYILYAILSFIGFSFLPQNQVLLIMSLSGAMLLIINLLGIFRLRHEISFAEVKTVQLPVLEKAN